MTEDRKAPWPERLAAAEAILAAEAAKPPPPEPEELEGDAITAALVGRTITAVSTNTGSIYDDEIGTLYLTLDDGTTVGVMACWGYDDGWLGVTRSPPA